MSESKPGILAELQRRKVVRVAAAYVLTAWVVLQVGDVLVEPLELPDYTQLLFLTLAALGFPIVVVIAWIFESTPDGVVVDSGSSQPSALKSRVMDWSLAAVAVLLFASSLLFESSMSPSSSSTSAANDSNPGQPRVLVVLPFESLSPLPENAYFAAGMYEDILAQLGSLRDVRVIARSSVERLPEGLALQEIAERLNATHVVEGSVRRDQDRARVRIQLIEPESDLQIWTATYDRTLEDTFAVQSEVAQRVAAELHSELGIAANARARQQLSPELYELFVRARELRRTGQVAKRQEALSLLESVTTQAPEFAPAWAQLAVVIGEVMDVELWHGENRTQALSAARRAIELAPDLHDGHLALGTLYAAAFEGRLRDAVSLLQRAVELAPNNAEAAVRYARSLDDIGETVRAVAILERAIELDPLQPFAFLELGETYSKLERADAAKSAIERALALAPENPIIRGRSAFALLRLEDIAGGISALYEGLKLDEQNLAMGTFLIYQLLSVGEVDASVRLLEHFERVQPQHPLVKMRRIELHLFERDFEAAVAVARSWLEIAPQDRQALRYASLAISYRGTALTDHGEDALAARDLREALRLARASARGALREDGTYHVDFNSAWELTGLANVLAAVGDEDEAQGIYAQIADQLAGMELEGMGTFGYLRALALIRTQESARAIEVLDASVRGGFTAAWMLELAAELWPQLVDASWTAMQQRMEANNQRVRIDLRNRHPELFSNAGGPFAPD